MIEQYYENNNIKECVTLNPRNCEFLEKDKYLSEFATEEQKEQARQNLGIDDIVQQFKDLLNTKIFEQGAVQWDNEPIEGNIDHVLSSDALYKVFQKYATLETLRDKWNYLINKINLNSDKINDLQNQVASCCGGAGAVSNEFGDNEHIGISQKTLTETIRHLYELLEKYTGNYSNGLIMTVDKEYFFGDTCKLNINATTELGKFDTITFYLNDEFLIQDSNVSELSTSVVINDTTDVKCVATIMGKEFTDTKRVEKVYPFYIGSGTKYTDVLGDESCRRSIKDTVVGHYDVEIRNTGDRLYLIYPRQFDNEVIKWDMNGFEIPYIRKDDEKLYVIYESTNRYNKKRYQNIDITNNVGYELNSEVQA